MKTINPLHSTPHMLSPHFSLQEFQHSDIAHAHSIDNTIPTHYIPTLEQLCRTILEPLRQFAGQPIIITSGYRCNALNLKVGGVYASQHTMGEAADIRLPKTPYTSWKDGRAHTDMDIAHSWIQFLREHTDFDQIILESLGNHDQELKDCWLHISCRKNRKKNRHQVLCLTKP
jgi:hypothetical protein